MYVYVYVKLYVYVYVVGTERAGSIVSVVPQDSTVTVARRFSLYGSLFTSCG